ncbi:MAG: class I SAM-dependent methyltransferase [Thermoplasmata archaeon]|nr:class I SAM-dependent methyltransferase [Thermoplasmata archaeon]
MRVLGRPMHRHQGVGRAEAEFDREASGYDRAATQTMPGYDELHQTLVWGIPFSPTRKFRVLELGIGTGTLSMRLLARYSHAELVGVDLSKRMIALSKTKTRRYRERVALVQGDLSDFPTDAPYDAVVSSLAIHHLENAEKWALFRKIRKALAPGGYFGDADDHLPEDPVFDSRFGQVAQELMGSAQPGALQKAWHEHERFDHPCTLSDELVHLEKAGFAHVDVPWRFFGQAVVWAYR